MFGDLQRRSPTSDSQTSSSTIQPSSTPSSQTMPTSNPSSEALSDPKLFSHGLAGVNLGMNDIFVKALFVSFAALCFIVLVARLSQLGNAHLRRLFSLSATGQQQRFWSRNQSRFWPNLKKHLIYAPLGKKRHNREIQLSSAINVGTLPSRFHALLLTLCLLSNFAYCAALNYKGKSKAEVIAQLRGRSGSLAAVNMMPLFVLAGRNNPLIRLLRVSFDTYNLLHRWMGRMVVLEALVHTGAWMANNVAAHGWEGVGHAIRTSPFVQLGLTGTVAMTFMLLQSPSAVRHAFYETFLHLHQAAALAAVIGVYFHIHMHALPHLQYIQCAIALWFIDRAFRFGRIFYRCWSWREGFSTVNVEALPGEACRVTVEIRRPWRHQPGSHVFVYLPGISYHQSHPFSVAWFERRSNVSFDDLDDDDDNGKGREKKRSMTTMSELELEQPSKQQKAYLSLVIQRRTGMTAKLYDRAAAARGGRLTLRGAVEGPYGALESLKSYGTVVLFAGGIGITHQVPHVRELIAGYANGTVATRKVVLVWTVRTTEHLEWVRPWMDEILQMPGRREVLKILLFVTKPKSPREVISPSATVQMFPGRPQPEVILDKEIEERIGAMAVTVCGPGALADTVRHATRRRVDVASLDFIEEAFTW
ncbi:MAG: hypothetical protein M1823_002178 [Watsoniomyces obsoletus]|nr:MAG: hypothetical protein M1823_002178 [Watsoniomyces obsoletus]